MPSTITSNDKIVCDTMIEAVTEYRGIDVDPESVDFRHSSDLPRPANTALQRRGQAWSPSAVSTGGYARSRTLHCQPNGKATSAASSR